MRERRTSRRFAVDWEILVKKTSTAKPSTAETATLHNLSSNGVFFSLPHALKMGTRIEIAIKLPMQKENWMKYEAEVVRVVPHSYGVGVAARFDSPKPLFTIPGQVDIHQAVKKS